MRGVAQDCINTVEITEQHLEKRRLIKDSPQGLRKGKSHFSELLRRSEEKVAMQGSHVVFLHGD